MTFKDLYIAEVERISAELEDAGINPDRAYDLASNSAYDAARERLFDHADAILVEFFHGGGMGDYDNGRPDRCSPDLIRRAAVRQSRNRDGM
jgi:hypothetical protein